MRLTIIAAALAGTALLAACSAAADGAGVSASPASTKPMGSATPTTPAAPQSAEPDATGAGGDQVRPNAEGMAVDALADAVLDQLKIDAAETFGDQLVTIAMSPLLREMAASADITTRLDSQGKRVILELSGSGMDCRIVVTDQPRARGVECSQ